MPGESDFWSGLSAILLLSWPVTCEAINLKTVRSEIARFPISTEAIRRCLCRSRHRALRQSLIIAAVVAVGRRHKTMNKPYGVFGIKVECRSMIGVADAGYILQELRQRPFSCFFACAGRFLRVAIIHSGASKRAIVQRYSPMYNVMVYTECCVKLKFSPIGARAPLSSRKYQAQCQDAGTGRIRKFRLPVESHGRLWCPRPAVMRGLEM